MNNDELWPSPEIRERARELRSKPTPAEKKLWKFLSNRQLQGFKFRRQHGIGRFIADFYCHSVRLFVELDGGVHAKQVEQDAERTSWFEERGFYVIRFANDMVDKQIDVVIEKIKAICLERNKDSND